MEDLLAVDVEAFRVLDLYQAERKFDEFKAQIIWRPNRIVSLHRVRTYLHGIEDILAERHEARRANALAARVRSSMIPKKLQTSDKTMHSNNA